MKKKIAIPRDAFEIVCGKMPELKDIGARSPSFAKSAFESVMRGVHALRQNGPDLTR